MFIYLVRNIVNGKMYVGQTVETVHRRWQHHRYAASGKRKHHFLNAIRKYGHELFVVETLCQCPTREALNETERFYIWLLASHLPSFGYNCELGGSNGVPTDSTRQKMRNSQLGRKHTPETRMKIAEANRKRVWSEESRKKSSLSHIGKTMPPKTEEYRKSVSDRQKGKPFSESRKLAISKALKGRNMPLEMRAKISLTLKGRPLTPLQIEYHQSRVGSVTSVETRAKQSVARIAYWEKHKEENAAI